MTTVENEMTLHRYWSSDCSTCAIKAQCTPSPFRRITRWEHEDVLEKMQRRLDETPEATKWRRQTVEHVFGTLKMWAGATHFLTQNAAQGANRDEFAGPGVQHEASDKDLGNANADRGNEGLKGLFMPGFRPSLQFCAA